MTINQVAREAADLIQQHGWFRGDYHSGDCTGDYFGKLCVAGALHLAADPETDPCGTLTDCSCDACAEFATWLSMDVAIAYNEPDRLLGYWNDHDYEVSSQQVVIDKLRDFAQQWEAHSR